MIDREMIKLLVEELTEKPFIVGENNIETGSFIILVKKKTLKRKKVNRENGI